MSHSSISKNQLRILITGCEAPGTSGTLTGLKYLDDKFLIQIFGCDTNLFSNSNSEFVKISNVPFANESNYIEKVSHLIQEWGIDIVIPQTTDEVLALAPYGKSYLKSARVLLPGDEKSIKLANDKMQLLEISRELGLPTSDFCQFKLLEYGRLESWLRNDGFFYIKSRNDSGGRGIIKVLPDKEYFLALRKKPTSVHSMKMSDVRALSETDMASNFFAMRQQKGVEFSVDVYSEGRNFLAIPRERVKIRSGVSQINRITRNESIEKATYLISKMIGLEGLFGYQFIFNSSDDYSILECNPRIQGSTFASIKSGSNILGHAVLRKLDIPSDLTSPRWNSVFVRTSGGIVSHE